MDNENAANRKRSVGGIMFTGALALGFCVFGSVLVYEAVVWTYRQEAAWNWPTAPGRIVAVHHSFRGGTSVEYSYQVSDKFYRSTCGDLPHFNCSRLAAGNKVGIRFDPQRPYISVFSPGFPWARLWELSYGIFILTWSLIMTMLTVDSYRHPENTRWTFGWKRRATSAGRRRPAGDRARWAARVWRKVRGGTRR